MRCCIICCFVPSTVTITCEMWRCCGQVIGVVAAPMHHPVQVVAAAGPVMAAVQPPGMIPTGPPPGVMIHQGPPPGMRGPPPPGYGHRPPMPGSKKIRKFQDTLVAGPIIIFDSSLSSRIQYFWQLYFVWKQLCPLLLVLQGPGRTEGHHPDTRDLRGQEIQVIFQMFLTIYHRLTIFMAKMFRDYCSDGLVTIVM